VTPAYATTLHEILERSRALGFLGPGSLRVQADHALGFTGGVAPPGRFLDLGSGGGVPGLVLAGSWDAAEAVLLDASARRCAFLVDAADRLGCADRVTVVRARAEEAARRSDLRSTFDVVVARGFGPPAVTAECGAPFLRTGGHLVVSEPPAGDGEAAGGTSDTSADEDAATPSAAAGSRWSVEGLAQLGLVPRQEWRKPFHYRSFLLEQPCPDRFPRRVGVPAKRPLF
jgi:16S rRNA (guanine527-N7)-methyltransferase